MKFKNILAEIVLQELGETTDAYDWYIDDIDEFLQEALFNFYSDDIQYEVKFRGNPENNSITVEFAPKPGEIQTDMYKTRHSTPTNQGNQFRIMATVLEISKHVWKNKHEIFGEDKEFTHFLFRPTGDKENNQRAKLYKQFIDKQVPHAHIETAGSKTFKVFL